MFIILKNCMKPFLILTVLTLAFTICKAQTIDKSSKEFIIDFYKQSNDLNKPFIYIKVVYQSEINEIIKILHSNNTIKCGA